MSVLASLQTRWHQLAPREQTLLRLASVLVLGAALWQGCLAPALATWRTAEPVAHRLAAELQHMQALQAQAQALQKQPPPSYDEALRALTLATRQTLGSSAQLNVAGDRVSITLQGAQADALAQWLAQARLNARVVPVEARLVRAGGSSGAAGPGAATWNGVLVMGLPAR